MPINLLHLSYVFINICTYNTSGDKMTTMTLAIPTELKQKLEDFPEINWSEVARQAFMQKIKDLEFLKAFKSESEMTEEEALRLGKEVRKKLGKRFRED